MFSLSITEMGTMLKREKKSSLYVWGLIVTSEDLWTIMMYRLFTWREANYLLQQCLSFVLQLIGLWSRHLSSHPRPAGFSTRQGHRCTHSGLLSAKAEEEKKITLNFFCHIAHSTALANMFVLNVVAVCFLLLCIASTQDDPQDKASFCDTMSTGKAGEE